MEIPSYPGFTINLGCPTEDYMIILEMIMNMVPGYALFADIRDAIFDPFPIARWISTIQIPGDIAQIVTRVRDSTNVLMDTFKRSGKSADEFIGFLNKKQAKTFRRAQRKSTSNFFSEKDIANYPMLKTFKNFNFDNFLSPGKWLQKNVIGKIKGASALAELVGVGIFLAWGLFQIMLYQVAIQRVSIKIIFKFFTMFMKPLMWAWAQGIAKGAEKAEIRMRATAAAGEKMLFLEETMKLIEKGIDPQIAALTGLRFMEYRSVMIELGRLPLSLEALGPNFALTSNGLDVHRLNSLWNFKIKIGGDKNTLDFRDMDTRTIMGVDLVMAKICRDMINGDIDDINLRDLKTDLTRIAMEIKTRAKKGEKWVPTSEWLNANTKNEHSGIFGQLGSLESQVLSRVRVVDESMSKKLASYGTLDENSIDLTLDNILSVWHRSADQLYVKLIEEVGDQLCSMSKVDIMILIRKSIMGSAEFKASTNEDYDYSVKKAYKTISYSLPLMVTNLVTRKRISVGIQTPFAFRGWGEDSVIHALEGGFGTWEMLRIAETYSELYEVKKILENKLDAEAVGSKAYNELQLKLYLNEYFRSIEGIEKFFMFCQTKMASEAGRTFKMKWFDLLEMTDIGGDFKLYSDINEIPTKLLEMCAVDNEGNPTTKMYLPLAYCPIYKQEIPFMTARDDYTILKSIITDYDGEYTHGARQIILFDSLGDGKDALRIRYTLGTSTYLGFRAMSIKQFREHKLEQVTIEGIPLKQTNNRFEIRMLDDTSNKWAPIDLKDDGGTDVKATFELIDHYEGADRRGYRVTIDVKPREILSTNGHYRLHRTTFENKVYAELLKLQDVMDIETRTKILNDLIEKYYPEGGKEELVVYSTDSIDMSTFGSKGLILNPIIGSTGNDIPAGDQNLYIRLGCYNGDNKIILTLPNNKMNPLTTIDIRRECSIFNKGGNFNDIWNKEIGKITGGKREVNINQDLLENDWGTFSKLERQQYHDAAKIIIAKMLEIREGDKSNFGEQNIYHTYRNVLDLVYLYRKGYLTVKDGTEIDEMKSWDYLTNIDNWVTHDVDAKKSWVTDNVPKKTLLFGRSTGSISNIRVGDENLRNDIISFLMYGQIIVAGGIENNNELDAYKIDSTYMKNIDDKDKFTKEFKKVALILWDTSKNLQAMSHTRLILAASELDADGFNKYASMNTKFKTNTAWGDVSTGFSSSSCGRYTSTTIIPIGNTAAQSDTVFHRIARLSLLIDEELSSQDKSKLIYYTSKANVLPDDNKKLTKSLDKLLFPTKNMRKRNKEIIRTVIEQMKDRHEPAKEAFIENGKNNQLIHIEYIKNINENGYLEQYLSANALKFLKDNPEHLDREYLFVTVMKSSADTYPLYTINRYAKNRELVTLGRKKFFTDAENAPNKFIENSYVILSYVKLQDLFLRRQAGTLTATEKVLCNTYIMNRIITEFNVIKEGKTSNALYPINTVRINEINNQISTTDEDINIYVKQEWLGKFQDEHHSSSRLEEWVDALEIYDKYEGATAKNSITTTYAHELDWTKLINARKQKSIIQQSDAFEGIDFSKSSDSKIIEGDDIKSFWRNYGELCWDLTDSDKVNKGAIIIGKDDALYSLNFNLVMGKNKVGLSIPIDTILRSEIEGGMRSIDFYYNILTNLGSPNNNYRIDPDTNRNIALLLNKEGQITGTESVSKYDALRDIVDSSAKQKSGMDGLIEWLREKNSFIFELFHSDRFTDDDVMKYYDGQISLIFEFELPGSETI